MNREQQPPPFASSALRARTECHRIVIVGGGAGGLELAVRLGDALAGPQAGAEVMLVDRGLSHVWKPLLHELAAGTLHGTDAVVDYLQQARRHRFRFHPGSFERLDRERREVWLAPLVDEFGEEVAPRRAVRYDTLVLALGSVVNDFGTPGVREHAIALDSADDAERFHRKLLAACARAELQGEGPVEVAIVGGGATGVELAAELVEAVSELADYGDHLTQLRQPVHVRVLEAGPRLLAALPTELAQRVQSDLEQRGIEVMLNQRVVEVRADSVVLGEGRCVPAQLVVWAAGIQAPPEMQTLGDLERNPAGQLVVRPTLQTTRDEAVFALGDCASLTPAAGARPVPPRAQVARQQARFLARALRMRLAGQPLPAFRYRDRGSLVSIGRDAIGSVPASRHGRWVTLQGLVARLGYWALHRQHIATLHGVGRTVLSTLGGWLAGRFQPRVKLH